MDLFGQPSWLAVHIGQGNIPEAVDPLFDYRGLDGREWLGKLRAAMTSEALRQPAHQQFIDQQTLLDQERDQQVKALLDRYGEQDSQMQRNIERWKAQLQQSVGTPTK